MAVVSKSRLVIAALLLLVSMAGAQWQPKPVLKPDLLGFPGLVGYWAFDNCLADDLSSQQRVSFVYISNLELACNEGVVGKAYRFRGVAANDHLEIENNPPLVLSEGYSLNLWFRLGSHRSFNGDRQETDYGTQVLISKSSDRTGISLRLEREPTDGLWYAYVSNGRCCEKQIGALPAVKLGGGITIGDWHMITLTFDPKRDAYLYLDGKSRAKVKSTVYNINPQTNLEPLTIGAESAGRWYPFNGDIDEVRVYDRVVSVVEIAKMYAQRKKPGKN
jgi:Concanavalin A-like lectin/glucanases superfamily